MSTRSGVPATRSAARSLLSRLVSGLAAAGLVAAAVVVGVAAPAGAEPPPKQTGQTAFEPGRYIVTLADPAVAVYDGGIGGYPATAPDEGDQLNARRAPVQNYSDLLESRQADVAAAAGATVDVSYTMALNAFSATLTSAQAAALSADSSVLRVTPDELLHVDAVPAPDFLGLTGDDGVWAALGGAEQAGDGVVVGVLDTGIAPENPAFAGAALGREPGAAPWVSGSEFGDDLISFVKVDGDTFTGSCSTGEQFGNDDCSTKIVSARYYASGFSGDRGDATTGEYLSPRDGDGHGSHTASTAAGNAGVPADVLGRGFGTVSGVAPAAKIAAYKVCWSGPDPTTTTDDGCSTTDILAAINQAVKDGVDVINYSIGGAPAQTTYSPTGAAFLGAASAGVFVAASAGNSGPGASTLDNAAPWITTVAASSIPSYYATVALGDGQTAWGASITVTDPVSGPLVNAGALAAAGADPGQAALCYPNTLDAALLPAGAIVVCDRGVVDRTVKSGEVARVGGIAMVLANTTPGSIDVDAHAVPTVHVDAEFHDRIRAYAATPGATATLTSGSTVEPPTPQVAAFSSRGPVLADGSDILKPDLAAPGVAILAAGANPAGGAPTFKFLSGTSMASPQVAGLAALYLGERPTAQPSEIKSALMTTAYDTLDATGAAVTDPFAQGAGHVDATRFFDPGLLYLNGPADWSSYLQGIGYDTGSKPVDPSDLNLASIAIGSLAEPQTVTRQVTSTGAGDYAASIVGLAGITAVVEPATLSFAAAGETKSFTVTVSRTDATLEAFATGSLVWASASTTVRSPIAVRPAALAAPRSVAGTGTSGSVEVTVTPGGTGDIPLSTTGLSRGALLADPAGSGPGHSGEGGAAATATYRTTVPGETTLARFDLDGADSSADLDLTVYRLDKVGNRIAGWRSASTAADERVDIAAPEPGAYEVVVVVDRATAPTTWDVTVTSVLPGGRPLALDPQVLAGVQGVDARYTASWSGLEPASTYVGLVEYDSLGLATVVQVSTGGEVPPPDPQPPVNLGPPVISGTPRTGATLTASTGEWDQAGAVFAYQWQADGAAIAGATGQTHVVTADEQGAVLSVVVTASVNGGPAASATSAGVAVAVDSATRVRLSRTFASSVQRVVATVAVTSASPAPATGKVAITVHGVTAVVPLTAENAGSVAFTLPPLPRGVWPVTAVYSGDAVLTGSTSPAASVWIVY